MNLIPLIVSEPDPVDSMVRVFIELSSGKIHSDGEQMAVFRVNDAVWGMDGNAAPLPPDVQVACEDTRDIVAALSDGFARLVANLKATVFSKTKQEIA